MTFDIEVVSAIGVLLTGWCLYLSSERGRIVEDIKELKDKGNILDGNQRVLEQNVMVQYLTKQEHHEFDNRISKSVDNLSVKIDSVLTLILKNHLKEP